MIGFVGDILAFGAQLYTMSIGDNNNVPITATRFLITPTNDLDSFTGFQVMDTMDGLIFVINIDSTKRILIKENNSGSSSGNRIFTATGGNLILLPGQLLIMGDQVGVGWFVFDIVGRRVETYSGTTNASGVYTVVFPTAYATTPDVQAGIINQSSVNQYIRITSISTTGFTINAFSRNTLTILGLDVLSAGTTNVSGAVIDVLVTEK